MRMKSPRIVREERGQEIIEFAFMLPLLALFLAGAIDFGRAYYEYNILTKSVRNAARYLSTAVIASDGTIPAIYVTRAKNIAVYGSITPGTPILPTLTTAQITVPPGTVASASVIYVTVSANYQYQSLFSFLLTNSTFHPKQTMIFGSPGVITHT
jgi:Flp pilus assembly protein TadG